MRIINNSKELTTLELDDKVVFGDLEYKVSVIYGYYLSLQNGKGNANNNKIFKVLNISKGDFIKNLGIDTVHDGSFPEVKSLEALTAIVSALFKEYEKQIELPKTWEEFCERNKNIPVFKLTTGSSINTDFLTHSSMDKNTCCSRQEAEAFLALMQLRQLRKAYVRDWKPDWTNDVEPKYCINLQANSFDVQCWYHMSNPFSFPTARLAKQFLDNFEDLLEIAKPLL